MNNMKKNRFVSRTAKHLRKHPLPTLLVGMGVALVALLGVRGGAPNRAVHIRWDIISLQFPDVFPGGEASAKAQDGSKITLTGSGTFLANAGQGQPQAVTGGGEWVTFAPDGTTTGSGTYSVTGQVIREESSGSIVGTPLVDHIGEAADSRAGLSVLTITYSDGSRGVLTVSCELPGAPHSVFEGITATKGFVAYWNHEQSVAGVDANRTVFHVLR